MMNWDQIQGNWKQMKGKIRQKWAEMTDDEYDKIAGKKEELSGWLQKKYGYTKDRADKEAEQFGKDLKM